jgi:hypothetical protein
MQQNSSANTGIGFTGALALLFITLKLCGVINWSWLWVLSPLWIPPAVIFSIFIIFVLTFILGWLLFSLTLLVEKYRYNRK